MKRSLPLPLHTNTSGLCKSWGGHFEQTLIRTVWHISEFVMTGDFTSHRTL